MKVAISGAGGFVAKHLKNQFKEYIEIKRNDTEEDILDKLQGVDAVFNLAGAPIIKRWNDEYKKLLFSSRIDTTAKLVSAINKSDVKHFISTSAIGAYPDNEVCDEFSKERANDYLGYLTEKWEEEALKCTKPTSIIRFGVILGNDDGALKSMILPFKLALGGIIGNGKMMFSWIDIDDLVSMYKFILDNNATGVFNAVSPNPVSNYVYTKSLGKVLKRPTVFPLPIFVLKIIFGEGSTVLSGSKEIYPKRILDLGFDFKYKTIDESLVHLL